MFDSFGRTLKNSIDQVGKLSPNARLLVIMSVLLIGCFLFIVSIYASKPQRVEIGEGTGPAYKNEALSQLQSAGIEATITNGALLVKKDDVSRANGLLAERGVLPADGTLLFQNLGEQMKWTNPREEEKKKTQK